MKTGRMIVFLLFVILLFQLTACGPDVSGDGMQNQPEGQTENGTPTEDPAPPTETEPPKELTTEERETAAAVYEMAPDDLLPFIFEGHQPFVWREDLDISKLEVGYLYICDTETNEVSATGIYGIGSFAETKDYFYYTVADDLTQILRSDYAGEEQTVVYETDRQITDFDFYGIDATGDFAIVLDSQQVILYHIATGETELLMEQYYIESVLYFGSSLGHRAAPDVGPTLHWRGLPTADADKRIDFYAYFIELDEMKAFDLPDG